MSNYLFSTKYSSFRELRESVQMKADEIKMIANKISSIIPDCVVSQGNTPYTKQLQLFSTLCVSKEGMSAEKIQQILMDKYNLFQAASVDILGGFCDEDTPDELWTIIQNKESEAIVVLVIRSHHPEPLRAY